MLNQDQVNKKILAKDDRTRFDHEWMEYSTRQYRDERWKTYGRKRKEFLDTAKNYYDMNRVAMLSNKTKLEHHYREMNFPFMDDVLDPETRNAEGDDENDSVRLLRTRHQRRIYEEMSADVPVCTIEPWFKRYLALGKFVRAVRAVILKKRLLKNLDLLRRVNLGNVGDFETESFTNAEVFEKFLTPPSEKENPSWIGTDSKEN